MRSWWRELDWWWALRFGATFFAGELFGMWIVTR